MSAPKEKDVARILQSDGESIVCPKNGLMAYPAVAELRDGTVADGLFYEPVSNTLFTEEEEPETVVLEPVKVETPVVPVVPAPAAPVVPEVK